MEWVEWACGYLAEDAGIVVPVKKMWNVWRSAHATPDLETFTAGLLADERVQALGGVNHAEGLEGLPPEAVAEHVAELEALGYFSGPRVKLRARELTLEHIVRMITLHNERMETALREARATLPEDADERAEGLLIDIQVQAAEFRDRLRQAGLETPPADADPAEPA